MNLVFNRRPAWAPYIIAAWALCLAVIASSAAAQGADVEQAETPSAATDDSATLAETDSFPEPTQTNDSPATNDPATDGPATDNPAADSSTSTVESVDSGINRNEALIASLTIFSLAVFVGFEIITKVPPTLHTPLMSGSNAISGITLVGAALVAGGSTSRVAGFLGMLAVALAAINVVGGFMVTDRMLSMFRKNK